MAKLLEQAADTSGMTDRFTYGSDPSQFVEVYGTPNGAANAVVFLHGGYFRESINLSHARPMARALADGGSVVGLVEYRRAGADGEASTGGHPHTLEDVSRAIRQFIARLKPQVDLVVAGHSAGGCLALAWASHCSPQGPPVAVRALAPITDLVREARLGLARGAVLDYMGVHPDNSPSAYLQEDPRSRAAQIPPRVDVLVLHGTDDATVDINYSRDFPATRLELEGAEHFDVIDPASRFFPAVAAALRP